MADVENGRKTYERYTESSYIDFGYISKGFFIFGLILLILYIIIYITAFLTSSRENWEGSYVGNIDAVMCALPVSFFLILCGVILYIFHRGLVDLGKFAHEVESGEFEKKILKELENEEKKSR